MQRGLHEALGVGGGMKVRERIGEVHGGEDGNNKGGGYFGF